MSAQKESIGITPLNSVPGFKEGIYGNYGWVAEHQAVERLETEIAGLNRQRAEVLGLPEGADEILADVRKQYDSIRQGNVAAITRALATRRTAGFSLSQTLLGLIPAGPDVLQQIEEAVTALGAAGIGAEERAKRVAKLDAQITAKISKLRDLVALEHGAKVEHSGRVVGSVRRAFTQFWRDIQRQCCERVGPTGRPYADSSDAERAAYDALGIKEFCHPDNPRSARVSPY